MLYIAALSELNIFMLIRNLDFAGNHSVDQIETKSRLWLLREQTSSCPEQLPCAVQKPSQLSVEFHDLGGIF